MDRDQVRDPLSKRRPAQSMGQEGQPRRELSEQASVTGKPLSILFQRPWSLWELADHGENANVACTFHRCPKDVQRSEMLCNGHVHSDPIAGSLKEKVTGFTQGSLSLTVLSAFSGERTGLLDAGRAVMVFYLDVIKAFSIIPPETSCVQVRIVWAAWVDE